MTSGPVVQPRQESATEVRCPGGALHFKVIDGTVLEVKCNNWRCTGGDSVVLHRYSLVDLDTEGKPVLIKTLSFTDPLSRGRRVQTSRKERP